MITNTRTPYPSDVTDRQWEHLELILPDQPRFGRRRRHSLREIVSAINYRWMTGCVWRMLPHDFPPWLTVYSYFRRWQMEGRISKIRAILIAGSLPEVSSSKQKPSAPTLPFDNPGERRQRERLRDPFDSSGFREARRVSSRSAAMREAG